MYLDFLFLYFIVQKLRESKLWEKSYPVKTKHINVRGCPTEIKRQIFLLRESCKFYVRII